MKLHKWSGIKTDFNKHKANKQIPKIEDVTFTEGRYDSKTDNLVFRKKNGELVIVSFSSLPIFADNIKPNPFQLTIQDYGHIVKLGDYEVKAETILFLVNSSSKYSYEPWLKYITCQ